MDVYIDIAVITSINDKNGFLKLKFIRNYKQQLLQQPFVFIDFFGYKKKLFVEKIIPQGKNYFLKFKNFSERRELEIFLNKKIFIRREDLLIKENDYLVSDLIDCKVFQDKNFIGVVLDVLEIPNNKLLYIKLKNNKEIFIPFVLNFFENINIESKIIYLNEESRFLYE